MCVLDYVSLDYVFLNYVLLDYVFLDYLFLDCVYAWKVLHFQYQRLTTIHFDTCRHPSGHARVLHTTPLCRKDAARYTPLVQ